jgi:hypothetical protein
MSTLQALKGWQGRHEPPQSSAVSPFPWSHALFTQCMGTQRTPSQAKPPPQETMD